MSQPGGEAPPEDARRLGARTATLLVVASMIGTGVFASSGLLFADLRSVPAVLLAWAVGGLLAVTGALSYAELVAALPKNGGEYHLLTYVYHPAVGFASGLVSFVVGFAAPIAASALAFGDYLRAAAPELAEAMGYPPLLKSLAPAAEAPPVAFETLAALGLVGVMSALHAGKVGAGRATQDLLTGFKVLLIVGFLVAGVVAGALDPVRLSYAERPLLDASLSPAFAIALVYVTFSYSGWNAATYVAGELDRPARSLPVALIAGTAIVTALYLGLNLVFLGGAPHDAIAGRVEVGHVAATHLFGEGAGRALSAIIAGGLVSTVGALIMTGTRVLDAMGRDHGPISFLARRARDDGPRVAVAMLAVSAAAMVLSSSFEVLLGYIGFTLSIFAALTVLGVIVLRVREPDLTRPYRAWGYPVTPLVFVGLMIWMIAFSTLEDPVVGLAGGATIGTALALYLVVRRWR